MCGIVSAISYRNIAFILTEGLLRLEYRGYDSCGIALFKDGELTRVRSMKRVADLEKQLIDCQFDGCIGLAHTRWATHGMPSHYNAHPHFSRDKFGKPTIALVHNGIIENYEELRNGLDKDSYDFESQTDTEVLAHLLNDLYDGDIFRTVHNVTKLLKGSYAIAVFCSNEPDRIIGARQGSPLIIGVGVNENYLSSDSLAISDKIKDLIYLEDGDIVDLRSKSINIIDSDGNYVERHRHSVNDIIATPNLGKYRHYMQKEIFEQPRAVADTLHNVNNLSHDFFDKDYYDLFNKIDSVLIVACGTSYYAGMTAKYWIESLAKIRVDVEIASEYIYRDSVPNPRTLVLAISQSGETADTLSALKHAKDLGLKNTMAICNMDNSAIVRACSFSYITQAGIEIGVASTKAFTTQLTALFLLTIALARSRSILGKEQEMAYCRDLRHLPSAISSVLSLEPLIMEWAKYFAHKGNSLFLGRGRHYPIALEGALKMKEVTYIHAEAYPAGELKHGPLALVSEHMPVVVVAPSDKLLEKLKSNMQEVRARGGNLYVLADKGSAISDDSGIRVIHMPECYGVISPILYTVPLQLLAYHTALILGTDIDKPRNLAKSVTVE
ncbi:MAG: glutamine--fructose-6-phosphate transaminase (isomerizing) [Candidatus Kinetoplastibacterium crithidii]|nr:MAG: glutamine--fructose-6-phosphate transaminase (isomerizing) [Candidatus Kinetoplastibacterium crithidii]